MKTAIFVISLESATDRRAAFAEQARNSPVDWSFFPAHTALGSDLTYDVDDAIVAKRRPLHRNELGCYSSHYAAWQRMCDDGADQGIFFEDDVVVDWEFVALLCRSDFQAARIHYLKLFSRNPTVFKPLSSKFLGRWLIDCRGYAYGAQAYMLTRVGAKTMLAACRRVQRPIDDEMDRSWAHGIPNLAVFPAPVFERCGPSTIGEARYDEVEQDAGSRLRTDLMRVAERARRLKQRVTKFGLRDAANADRPGRR